MQELTDTELLRQYAEGHSEAAFETLVARHVHLVYSAACRKTGNCHSAEEITQAVFIILAKKARSLRRDTILSGWLYQAARLTASNFLRNEIRRVRREQEATMPPLSPESEPETWPQIVPLLEDAMGRLNEKERNAIILRFFEGKSFQEIGATLGASENAAKKRVAYSLEKLRDFFAKRGVNSTTAIIARAISSNSIQAAPVGLVKSISAVALAKGAAASTTTLTLVKGALKLMAWTNTKTAIVVGVGLLLAAGTTTVMVKEIKARQPEIWQAGFDMSVLDRVPPQAKILPALRSRDPNVNSWRGRPGDGKIMGLNDSATEILSAAYGVTRARMIFLSPVPEGKYDFISNVPKRQPHALQLAIKKTFDLVGNYQLVETNVLELVVRKPAVGLKRFASTYPEFSGGNGFIWLSNQPISNLAYFNEYFLGTPVENRTRLTGYYDLKWDYNTPNSLQQAELENLGLELVPTNLPIEMLVVEKAN